MGGDDVSDHVCRMVDLMWYAFLLQENIATIPNILSFGRILTSPVLGYLVMSNSYPAAFGLFTVAGLSDVVRLST